MNLSIISSTVGFFLINENKEILLDFLLPNDHQVVASVFFNLKHGKDDGYASKFIEKVAEHVKVLGFKGIVEIDDIFLYQRFQDVREFTSLYIKASEESIEFRGDLPRLIGNYREGLTPDDFYSFNRQVNVHLTRMQIKEISQQNDKLIIQAVNAIDDINKSANIFAERIREWYGLHFPELTDRIISDHEFFLEIVKEIGFRDDFSAERLKLIRPIEDNITNRIIQRAQDSMGGEFSDYDMKTLQYFAETILRLYKTRRELESYVESMMQQICPNLSAIIGPLLGARLLCLAGGLDSLARKPSSTIQLLGAEKALFRAMKMNTDPPKHGVIFQSNYIRKAPYWQRGKIARVLSGKISIAIKVDNVSKRYVADTLIDDIKRKIDDIQRKYPEKPKPKPKSKVRENARTSKKPRQFDKRTRPSWQSRSRNKRARGPGSNSKKSSRKSSYKKRA
ncbi:MAG: hypothetical protein ACTSVI_16715 [Promethearchaeota archaeon]